MKHNLMESHFSLDQSPCPVAQRKVMDAEGFPLGTVSQLVVSRAALASCNSIYSASVCSCRPAGTVLGLGCGELAVGWNGDGDASR